MSILGKEKFKEFVKKNPSLIKHVQNGSMSWQKFYEMYDIYGEDEKIWNEYLSSSVGSIGIFEMFKNLDVESIQNGINSVQRVLGLIQEMGSKNKNEVSEDEYKPRPLYKHFEDWFYLFNLKLEKTITIWGIWGLILIGINI